MDGIEENIEEIRDILEDVYDLTGIEIEVGVDKFIRDYPENTKYLYTIYEMVDGKSNKLASRIEYESVITFISGLVTGFDYNRTKLFNKISLN